MRPVNSRDAALERRCVLLPAAFGVGEDGP